jgi:hypothetical protein
MLMGYERRMRPLASLRSGWESVDREDNRFRPELSVSESVSLYLALQQEFEGSLQVSEPFFRSTRMAGLAELQLRLLRLNCLGEHH